MSQHSMDDVVRNYARDVLGMQREDLNEFLWIADEAMRAPLPDGWEQHEDESRGKPYYVNEDTGETQWTHPSDDFYREKFQRLRRQRRPQLPARDRDFRGGRGRSPPRRQGGRRSPSPQRRGGPGGRRSPSPRRIRGREPSPVACSVT